MLSNLDIILKKSLRAKGIDKSVEAAKVCNFYNKNVAKILGVSAGKNSQAIYVKNNVLFVAVSSSVWACELNLKQIVVLDNLNKQKIISNRIKKIIFKAI